MASGQALGQHRAIKWSPHTATLELRLAQLNKRCLAQASSLVPTIPSTLPEPEHQATGKTNNHFPVLQSQRTAHIAVVYSQPNSSEHLGGTGREVEPLPLSPPRLPTDLPEPAAPGRGVHKLVLGPWSHVVSLWLCLLRSTHSRVVGCTVSGMVGPS